jgi:hypothetical protein
VNLIAIEERANEEEIALAQQWRGAMKRQVHNIIVSTLETSETMLEEVDPDSDPEELRVELMAAAINAVAAMGGGTKEKFMEMAKKCPPRNTSTETMRTTLRASTPNGLVLEGRYRRVRNNT